MTLQTDTVDLRRESMKHLSLDETLGSWHWRTPLVSPMLAVRLKKLNSIIRSAYQNRITSEEWVLWDGPVDYTGFGKNPEEIFSESEPFFDRLTDQHSRLEDDYRIFGWVEGGDFYFNVRSLPAGSLNILTARRLGIAETVAGAVAVATGVAANLSLPLAGTLVAAGIAAGYDGIRRRHNAKATYGLTLEFGNRVYDPSEEQANKFLTVRQELIDYVQKT